MSDAWQVMESGQEDTEGRPGRTPVESLLRKRSASHCDLNGALTARPYVLQSQRIVTWCNGQTTKVVGVPTKEVQIWQCIKSCCCNGESTLLFLRLLVYEASGPHLARASEWPIECRTEQCWTRVPPPFRALSSSWIRVTHWQWVTAGVLTEQLISFWREEAVSNGDSPFLIALYAIQACSCPLHPLQ